ncbi:hypothetical protein A3206_04810 [Candidatus Methanomassiliicoccus intestinalis]|uniref:Monovalent cation:proton antiporter-2 (CPA2) family protein n=1 Tax=Methanomassiliicoccus intestinalis (strain Issoire-Mx1) TaxID=1295009 RepID=R9T7U3_METII|nr:cation:proton antiporter [Candidatus Methanomassiliicoccus intestinalis]AGN27012.1 monovalent cation:proton antiporter-2 (CPA2) family protein [Candidatus Methanomassiliicoccus intestinalis Issoire-Mx1]TQS81009.1 MAG: hypothetical protein A3206_04810 [Candidatus Methanomassiliicoccus intestinalis]
MESEIYLGLLAIFVIGIGAQWLGRLLRIPPLLILLPAGLIAGGVFGIVKPEQIFGDLLYPGVTFLVSLLLFQSALKLHIADLPAESRKPVVRLTSIGLLITIFGTAVLLYYVLDVSIDMALLVGAILGVSGPTVIGPLIKSTGLKRKVASVLEWEGVFLDPIGATIGIVILNVILSVGHTNPILNLVICAGFGIAVGIILAILLTIILSRNMVSDTLEAAVCLMFAVIAFTFSEVMVPGSGLFASTVLGFILGNQRAVSMTSIKGFGMTVEVLIIGILFVTLGALVPINGLITYIVPIVIILVFVILILRPLASRIALSGTKLSKKEKIMIAFMEPRGIVAAATASQFSVSLTQAGIGCEFLLPVVFGVVLGAGIIYSIIALPLARHLEITEPPRHGVGFISNKMWAIELAGKLKDVGVSTLVFVTDFPERIDSPRKDVKLASIHYSMDDIDKALEEASLSQLIVVAPESTAERLIEFHASAKLGRRYVMNLPHNNVAYPSILHSQKRSRIAFSPKLSQYIIESMIESGGTIEIMEKLTPGDVALAIVYANGNVDMSPGDKVYYASELNPIEKKRLMKKGLPVISSGDVIIGIKKHYNHASDINFTNDVPQDLVDNAC